MAWHYIQSWRARRVINNVTAWMLMKTKVREHNTHSRFTALCPMLPRWAGTRRDIHPLTPETCCGSLSSFWILWGMGEINRGKCTDNPAGRHPIRTTDAPTSIIPQFYAGFPSCRNPPNLSWLGTGTKYAGLHTCRLGRAYCYKKTHCYLPWQWPRPLTAFTAFTTDGQLCTQTSEGTDQLH